MYLYSRTGTPAPGKVFDVAAFAREITEKVNSITSLDVTAWATVYGGPIGTVTWVATVEHPSDMAVTGDKLVADASYLDMVAGASELFAGPVEDAMTELLSVNGAQEGDVHYASYVSAQCAPGRIAEAMAWGVDMAEHVHSVTGRDGVFGRSMYGPWASVGWISLAETAEQIDAAEAALAADPTYVEKLDQAGALFQSSTAMSGLSRRIS